MHESNGVKDNTVRQLSKGSTWQERRIFTVRWIIIRRHSWMSSVIHNNINSERFCHLFQSQSVFGHFLNITQLNRQYQFIPLCSNSEPITVWWHFRWIEWGNSFACKFLWWKLLYSVFLDSRSPIYSAWSIRFLSCVLLNTIFRDRRFPFVRLSFTKGFLW